METTKHPLSSYAKRYFETLSDYLELKLYYFGSIQRNDYFPESSDIDVDIFTSNESSTLYKIQSFLKIDKNEIKKFLYRLQKSNTLVSGYKIKIKKPEHSFFAELSIYNERFKDLVLEEHQRKFILPWYISSLLIILKFVYYKINILPKELYEKWKNFLIQKCIDGAKADFIVLNN